MAKLMSAGIVGKFAFDSDVCAFKHQASFHPVGARGSCGTYTQDRRYLKCPAEALFGA